MKSLALALAEVSLATVSLLVVAWVLQIYVPTGFGWYFKALMIVVGLIAILLHGKPHVYGLKPKNIRFSLKWSVYLLSLFISSILIALAVCLARGLQPPTTRDVVLGAIWSYIFIGFAEELFFRGYVQSRLNEVFAKKYRRFLWVDAEWSQGTLIAAIFFFGIPHLLNEVNPFIGRYAITPFTVIMTLSASFMGTVWGVIREKTGFILIPTVIHGSLIYTVFILGKVAGLGASNMVAAITLFIFFAVFFEKMMKEPLRGMD